MATIKQIRDDTRSAVGALSAVSSRGITPVAMWVPQFDRGDVLPRIIVAPSGRVKELIGRGIVDQTTRIQVAVMETLGEDAEAAGTAGHVLLDAIIDGLLSVRLSGSSNALCTAAQLLTLNAPEHWRELQQFTGVVELTFRA